MPWYAVVFHFLFFCLKATVKTNTWMRRISVTVMVVISKVLFWKLLDFSYVQTSFSAISRNIHNGIWNILYIWRFYGTWVNIHASSSASASSSLHNSFLVKYHEMKMIEGALEIISCTKIRACSLKNIALGDFTNYCIVPCFSNKPSF